MTATLITQYLGGGLLANRPATPTIDAGAIAWYYATDNTTLYYYANGAWNVQGAGATPAPTWQWLNGTLGSTTTETASCIGLHMNPSNDLAVSAASFLITTVTGATYKIGIATYDNSGNKITGAPSYSAVFTAGTGAANSWVNCKFASPVTMTHGTDYIVFLVRTDALAATSLTHNENGGTTIVAAPGLIAGNSSTDTKYLASLAPTTSDTWSTINEKPIMALNYTIL